MMHGQKNIKLHISYGSNLGEVMYLSKHLSRRKFYISPTSENVVLCKTCIEENNLTTDVTVVLISLVALNFFMKQCRINRKQRTVRFKSIGSFQQLLCGGTSVAFLYLSKVDSIKRKEREGNEWTCALGQIGNRHLKELILSSELDEKLTWSTANLQKLTRCFFHTHFFPFPNFTAACFLLLLWSMTNKKGNERR